MVTSSHQLVRLYKHSHDFMRDMDGLQPHESFDELLKYLFVKQNADEANQRLVPFITSIFDRDITSNNGALINDLRNRLREFLSRTQSWSTEMWEGGNFRLSDTALLSVHQLFENIDFTTIDIDTRSAALTEFITSDMRKGLGIFPTPDGVVRMMVEVMSPRSSARVFDPACGTGTFLIEMLRHWHATEPGSNSHIVWGVDKNPRMLLLSELNLGHNRGTEYRRALADSMYQSPLVLFDELMEGFDYILTNPPFGMRIDRDKNDLTQFLTCRDNKGSIVKRQQSEVIFLEQCLKYLKPGGSLSIVLPRSILTNTSLASARQAINSLGYLEAIVNLPPETFSMSGAQTNAVVLFLRRYAYNNERDESISIACADIENVGFDATGRPRNGNQLKQISRELKGVLDGGSTTSNVCLLPKTSKGHSLVELHNILSGRLADFSRRDGMYLGDIVDLAINGKTPSRSSYSDSGLFLVKVGNLTGRGIDWTPRSRNFVTGKEQVKRRGSARLMLRDGDIVLTSSAHSPVYIAKKVDLVDSVPKWVGGEASFVGEVMLLRPQKDFDAAILLAYLRLPSTQRQIQSMIRGQTAHLHPDDLLQLMVPKCLLDPPPELLHSAVRVRIQAELSAKLNEVSYEQRNASSELERAIFM